MAIKNGDAASLKVEQWWNSGALVVSAEGRINGFNAMDFHNKLSAALNKQSKSVILDCEHLTYISSAGLRVILMAAKDLRKRGAKFSACSLAPTIMEVFVMTGFDRIIQIHDSLDEAVESFQD